MVMKLLQYVRLVSEYAETENNEFCNRTIDHDAVTVGRVGLSIH